MINFFRNIREKLLSNGKTGKYLKYAIGEIVLVMVGILLALQVNNWNENRKEQNKVTSFLTKMREEIKSDIKYLMESDSVYAIYESNTEKAIERIYQAKTIQDILIADSLFSFKWNDLPIHTSTYDEMLNTGSFYTLNNKNLQDRISKYYSLIESFQYYIKQVNIELQELSRNPNLLPCWFIMETINRDCLHYNEIDTSWIGNVNSPTFLALNNFYLSTQRNCNTYRRKVIQIVLSDSNELVNEIEKELDK